MTKPLYEAPSLDDVLPDLIFAQNLPSILCSQVLDPQPGECVVDMCASPGIMTRKRIKARYNIRVRTGLKSTCI